MVFGESLLDLWAICKEIVTVCSLPPSAREVAPQGRRERALPSPEIFRAAAKFSPPPPAGGAPSQRWPRGLIRQLQRIYPPAIPRRHQAHRRYSGGIGHNRLLPCPAFKIVALAGQRELPECKAAVGLQLRFGEKMPAVGDVAAAVEVGRSDGEFAVAAHEQGMP